MAFKKRPRPPSPLDRALRAAAGAALLGPLGCGDVPLDGLESPAQVQAVEVQTADAGFTPPSLTLELDTTSVRTLDLGSAEVCQAGEPDWVECCQRIGWDANRGCSAWGPPAPPVMPGENAA